MQHLVGFSRSPGGLVTVWRAGRRSCRHRLSRAERHVLRCGQPTVGTHRRRAERRLLAHPVLRAWLQKV